MIISLLCVAQPAYAQNNLRIVTTELPAAIMGIEYSAALIGAGGAPPYRFSMDRGSSLPPGLQLSGGGVIGGIPRVAGSFTFTVQIADTRGNNRPRDSQTLRLTIAPQTTPSPPPPPPQKPPPPPPQKPLPPPAAPPPPQPQPEPVPVPQPAPPQPQPEPAFVPPVLSLIGLPSVVSAAQAIGVQLELSSPFSAGISGTLKVAFTPGVALLADDPSVQFSTGGRTVEFNIPAGSTRGVLSQPVSILTGTTAGVIRLTADLHGGSADVPLASTIVRIGPPQITNVAAQRGNGILHVQVTGYSPDRSVTAIQFGFDIRVPGTVQRVVLERNVVSEFEAWYQDPASFPFGTAFFFEQFFTVTGDQHVIEAITVTLVNNLGASATVGARFPSD